MKLYHGSAKYFESIRKSQAEKGEGVEVPEEELLDGIYLTPNYGFALAIGAMPDGTNHIDDENKEIEFQNVKDFDPEKRVFVYEIDSEKIPREHLKQVDENQFVVTGIDELIPDAVEQTVAREVLNFYRIKDFGPEGNREQLGELKKGRFL